MSRTEEERKQKREVIAAAMLHAMVSASAPAAMNSHDIRGNLIRNAVSMADEFIAALERGGA